MAKTPDTSLKRWRETKEFKPFGEDVRTLTRVVEGPDMPDGATATTDDLSDWNASEAK